jgi:membrane-associated phospholipid phosphatase
VLVTGALAIPILFFAAFSFSGGRLHGKRYILAEFSSAFVGFFLAFCANLALMEYFKRSLGVPRPIFFSLSELIKYDNSTYAEKFTDERYMNCPSGHASCSMMAFLYLSFYLSFKANQSHPLTTHPGKNVIRQWVIVASYIPFFVATWVASTRVEDYWHSPVAVVLGMLLGVACATFGWFSQGLPFLQLLVTRSTSSPVVAKASKAFDMQLSR